MEFFLTHTSALECWRHVPRLRGSAGVCERYDACLGEGIGTYPRAADLALLRRRGFDFLTHPVHLAVADASARTRHKHAVSHLCPSAVFPDSFVKVAEGVFASPPELVFVHLSTTLSRPKLIELGFELCGSYGKVPGSPKGFVSRKPLTTTEKVADFASSQSGMRGSAVARRALRYVLLGAESPMEPVVVMLLCLPTRFGGYGLPFPVLNYRIEPTGDARSMTDKSHLRCDLCWPDSRLVVEYDSDWAHSGSERISADASRRAALTYMGMQVVTVTRRQVMNLMEMDRVAKVLAQQLGVSLRTRKADWRQAQLQLRSQLLDFSEYLEHTASNSGAKSSYAKIESPLQIPTRGFTGRKRSGKG